MGNCATEEGCCQDKAFDRGDPVVLQPEGWNGWNEETVKEENVVVDVKSAQAIAEHMSPTPSPTEQNHRSSRRNSTRKSTLSALALDALSIFNAEGDDVSDDQESPQSRRSSGRRTVLGFLGMSPTADSSVWRTSSQRTEGTEVVIESKEEEMEVAKEEEKQEEEPAEPAIKTQPAFHHSEFKEFKDRADVFTARLFREDLSSLGVSCSWKKPETYLTISQVLRDSVVAQWNEANPGSQIECGCRILAANGTKNPHKVVSYLRSERKLTLVLQAAGNDEIAVENSQTSGA